MTDWIAESNVDPTVVGVMPYPEKGGASAFHYYGIYAGSRERPGGTERVELCAEMILDFVEQFYVPKDHPDYLKYEKEQARKLVDDGFYNLSSYDELVAAGLEEYANEIPPTSREMQRLIRDPGYYTFMPMSEGYSRVQQEILTYVLLSRICTDRDYDIDTELAQADELANTQVFMKDEIVREMMSRYRFIFAGLLILLIGFGGYLVYKYFAKKRDASAAVRLRRITLGKRAASVMLLVPAVFLILVWAYYPLLRGSVMAFQDVKVLGESRALAMASKLTGAKRDSWDALELPPTRPDDETLSRYWCEFTSSGAVPPTAMELRAPEVRFREFLKGKYGSAEKLNVAWGTAFANFDDAPLPLALADYSAVRFAPWTVRGLFVTESYRRVGEYMAGRGRAAWNTLILVLFSLICALTINPIAAYSLSRFPMKSTQKILIFFLATMAFPAEVAMIPNFLLLRDLGLLNTYAALILPTMANGFAIFLLKGFFDSLPRELYEAAEIDGASEIQIFRMVAMPLVTPILAFIGLSTFVLAYSSFMWAFVICPKEEMWTLTVWVYDFQMKNPGNNYVMAATVLVSIPPLIVFFFANRIIMKGIVIPSLK